MRPLKSPTETDRLAVQTRPSGRKPVMYQRWADLLFLHRRYDPAAIQRMLPPRLTVDTFEGNAYIGVVPFFMCDVRPSFFPQLPGISDFLELNVRTYVHDEYGVPGVWFYSLDANQWLAVRMARRFFSLPYFDCKMKAEKSGTTAEIRYLSHRLGTDAALSSCFQHSPRGATRLAQPGTLDFFLIERYVLFTQPANHYGPWSGRVHHEPYPLLDVELTEWDDASFELDGLNRPGRTADHAVMSPGVAVEVFSIQPEVSSPPTTLMSK